MKGKIRICVVISLILLVVPAAVFFINNIFNRCLDALFGPYEFPEEGLTLYQGWDLHIYEYQDKAAVYIRFDENETDNLDIKTKPDDDSWNYSETILSGEFEKFACYEGNLFIFMDNTYYTLDINKYEIPLNSEDDVAYDLNEYTISEFEYLYPQYQSFDWYY